jgi:adenosylcobinamide-GDP ribazoletransferase
LKNIYLGLKFAFSYFSILPIKFQEDDDLSTRPVLASMLFFFPLVGLVLGFITIGLFTLLHSLSWYGALLSAVAYMVLYGFLHTEAVSDVADAIYASHSGKDAYAIIKDPTVGAMGVLYAVAVVLLKVGGISYLLLEGFFMEFVMVLVISRLSLLLLFYVHTFRSSFATQLKESLTHTTMSLSFLLFGLIGMLLVSNFSVLLLLGLLFALLISYAIKSKIGFVNGDVLGATLEGVEILLCIVVGLLWL